MKLLKSVTVLTVVFSVLFSCSSNENFFDKNLTLEPEKSTKSSAVRARTTTLKKPVVLGYFPSWSESFPAANGGTKLRDIPKHVTHVFLAFAKPNLTYQKGSLDITGTGIETPYEGDVLKESVAVLKSKGTKVILSIGGETYWGSDAAYNINYQQIKDLVDDIGFEGIDWDFEPNGSFATIGSPINVQRFKDFFINSRAIMPKGEYLLACAPAGVGALGGVNNDDSTSPFAYDKRNALSGESDAGLYNATSPNKAISLFGFATTGHMIPVLKAVGDKIDLIAYQGYNTGAASNRKIMYDSYKYYANIYGFSIAAGTHFPNEPWGPYYTYTYENMADLSGHIAASNSSNDGVMIWQLLLGANNSSAYGYLYTASQVLGGVSQSQAIVNAENYPRSPYTGGGGTGGNGCSAAQWLVSKAYTEGQEASYQNKLYKAKWWTKGDVPSENTESGQPWEYLQDCGGGTGGGTTNVAPSVVLTAPSNNTSVIEGDTVLLSALASDSDGSVTKVEFFVGTTKLGEDITSPYAFSWSNVVKGNYTVTALATDNDGANTTSSAITIIVDVSTGGTSCVGISGWKVYPVIYNKGDRVVYNNTIYEAQTGPIWVTPGSGEHWWKTIGSCK